LEFVIQLIDHMDFYFFFRKEIMTKSDPSCNTDRGVWRMSKQKWFIKSLKNCKMKVNRIFYIYVFRPCINLV